MDPNYLVEGVKQAGQARSHVGFNWSDSWKDYAVQYALSQQANDQEIAMWNMMNEYNSPSAQMARYKEAGLNPMLMYSQLSNGNAGSPANVHVPNVKVTPQQDALNKMQGVQNMIGMVSNLAKNVMSIFDAGYETEIKRNEAAFSNLEYAAAKDRIRGFGQGRDVHPGYKLVEVTGPDGQVQTSIPEYLNPFSPNFSPTEYMVLNRIGKIPNYFESYMTAEPQSDLYKLKGDYQKWYNEKLAPFFERYQAGKADSAEWNALMDEYNYQAMTMLPPGLRGILQPIVEFISPFLKIFLKGSFGKFTHTVK